MFARKSSTCDFDLVGLEETEMGVAVLQTQAKVFLQSSVYIVRS